MENKRIQEWQRKRLFGLAHELGMTTHSKDRDDDLHVLTQGIVGIDSLSALTYAQANGVISELEHRQRFGLRVNKQHPEKPGGVSADQQKKIWAMMYELRGYDLAPSTASLGDRLAGIIRKELQMDATAENPFAWLTGMNGNYLIDKVLKHYLDTAKRNCRTGGET